MSWTSVIGGRLAELKKAAPGWGRLAVAVMPQISAPARASNKCGNLRLWDAAVARADAIQQLETGGERDAADRRLYAKSAYGCPYGQIRAPAERSAARHQAKSAARRQSKCVGVGRSFDRFAKYRVHIRWTIR